MKVVIFIGSEYDFDVVRDAIQIFKEFEVPFHLEVTSAHRSPDRTVNLIEKFEKQDAEIFIAVAGKAAHLAGVVAAHTLLPVIGVPVRGSSLSGLDALLSTSQMPEGVPVACMGIGKSGASNAALLSIQILALKDPTLKERMREYRRQMASRIEEASKKIQENL
ncbi:MAG: 5-(carboxyamino)imidazole ribonucleotide mutase [Candidatus Aminicenantes bacterium]|nr:5-(carboxyamino)imidazole ribonucleotide mutase [Candidatus Aminicenantes bacterium]MDH5383137.1 5-(carboxyamino)imidazole ribonucleotide mutase [Candidatus Aminicenantes bacterium]MDH5742448.1 5-(carboxyamino)imidazole ribonucleotide mutase [Candidatus Aminicenantes bacterium]